MNARSACKLYFEFVNNSEGVIKNAREDINAKILSLVILFAR
jgi:hypothetical protein